MQQLSITFTTTAGDEIQRLTSELELLPLAQAIQDGMKDIPDNLKYLIGNLLGTLLDIFSSDLPDVVGDPEETLRKVSRDINLSRLLRERGIFRLYRLVHTTDENNLPVYMSLVNPLTGNLFATQEDFVSWFCEEAHVSRSLVFQRFMAIDRLLHLNMDLESAFQLLIKKPYAIRETLNQVAFWDKGKITEIPPDTAVLLTERFNPDLTDDVKEMIRTDNKEGLNTTMLPIITNLLQEVGDHERAKDALDWVQHDLLRKPEIKYAWDGSASVLMVEIFKKGVDKYGNEMLLPPVVVPFVADTDNVPQEIIDDLMNRLPIRNRLRS